MFKLFRAVLIHYNLLVFGVIATINLNDKPVFQTNEINDVVAYYILSVKFNPYIVTSQIFPKYHFCLCRKLLVLLCKFLQEKIPVWGCIIVFILKAHLSVSFSSPPWGGREAVPFV